MLGKILYHIAYSTNYANFAKPTSITFDVTDRCLLHCKTCYKWLSKDAKNEIDTSSWKEIIYSLKQWLGNYRVCISGGELFLRDDIFDIISFARKYNVYVTAISNGYHINSTLAEKVIASGLNGISITLNGITPGVHDFTRGMEGSYEKVLQAIDLLNKPKKNMFVCIETVLMGYNQHEVIDLIKFVKERHLDGITFQALYDTSAFRPFDRNDCFNTEGEWYKNHPLWPKDTQGMLSVIDKIAEYKRKGYPIGNSFISLQWMKRYFQDPKEIHKTECMVGMNNFSVDPYGKVRLCFNMNPIGNILSQRPKQLWTNEKAFQQRRAIKTCKNTCRILMCNFDK